MDYKILNKPGRNIKKTSQILERISYIEEMNDDHIANNEITMLYEEIKQLKDFNWILLDKLDSQYKEIQSLMKDLQSAQKSLPETQQQPTMELDNDTRYKKLESQLYAQKLMIEELDHKIISELKSIKRQQEVLTKDDITKKQAMKWFQFWKK
ncbi:hypothetical protein [Bacillus sp. Marseille-P3661]|uniref:hypothetical protein n=1 Tax=Bacillus sp. Marseille-P3661 TaxID=1936234 RepID=UPI000C823AE8|nr:hypothetical protein [Bacillus sp. Marseille-P3661]